LNELTDGTVCSVDAATGAEIGPYRKSRMNRKQVVEFAAMHRIHAMYEFGFIVRDGGLMSYGPSDDDGFREAARYIDRILKGAKPGDLPAMQPTRYYLAVNLKTATTLGLTMPPSVLLRADQVIE
jgi:ABC-type uncharacterized transport system substrate-binding protein